MALRPGSAAWWLAKLRQTRQHLAARVTPEERASLAAWLAPAQLAVFDQMHVADRRHGLDVVAALRAAGETDGDVCIAGLLHDAGKGDTGVIPRIVYSLGQARFRLPARIDLPSDQVPAWVAQVEREMVVANMDWGLLSREGPAWMSYWDQHVRGTGKAQP